MSNLANLSREELVERQQSIMAKRSEAEVKFKEQASEVQFELDKRDARERLGGSLTPAELAVIAELAEAQAAESEVK